MQEREMRRRVERFLQTRLRSMLMPATLGLGLALGGCSNSTSPGEDADSTAVKRDVGPADTQVPPDGPLADVSTTNTDVAGATGTDAGLADTQGTEAQATEAGSKQDLGNIGVKYLAQFPDAGADLPQSVAEYMAQLPDAGGGMPLYMAPMPRYMAQLPDARS